MKLLVDLIAELSTSQPSLIDALVKTKVLLHQVGRKDLVEWGTHEINGYPDEAQFPSYRIVSVHVKSNVTNNAYTYNDHPLPTMHLTDKQRKGLEELDARRTQLLCWKVLPRTTSRACSGHSRLSTPSSSTKHFLVATMDSNRVAHNAVGCVDSHTRSYTWPPISQSIRPFSTAQFK